ncbi:hypothetical protein [Trichormus sp. NMC-1]|uniref:hypothetical protein n=1 Tax=Trichormus sp. NMC-1 TaxID=1853259 RepID=UPI0015A6E982|nr:hypothetical protein [Trichormus sp. NMC-1]
MTRRWGDGEMGRRGEIIKNYLPPAPYSLPSITHHPSPITYHLSPITCHLSPAP